MSLFLNGSTSNFREMSLRVRSTYKSTMFSSNSHYMTIKSLICLLVGLDEIN